MALYSDKLIKYARLLDIVMSLVMLGIGVIYDISYLWIGAIVLLILTALNYQKWLINKIVGIKNPKNNMG